MLPGWGFVGTSGPWCPGFAAAASFLAVGDRDVTLR